MLKIMLVQLIIDVGTLFVTFETSYLEAKYNQPFINHKYLRICIDLLTTPLDLYFSFNITHISFLSLSQRIV